LLVVIAIIGVLSSVVLASLNTARSKGSDAAIQSDLATVRTQASLYYGDNGNSYGTQVWSSGAASACTGGMFSDGNISRALAGADTANGTGDVDCVADGTSYLAAAALLTTADTYWCVDSTGAAKMVDAALPTTAIATCP
jgi:type II secretory pathway pseudopilin PulG